MYKFALVLLTLLSVGYSQVFKIREDKTKCPRVKAIRNLDLEELLGKWYVIQHYASSEEAVEYSCMRAEFSISAGLEVTMNFSYNFVDDPLRAKLVGNITWQIPNLDSPAHWTHAEESYEGIYNTYVLDSDYKTWALLLHCAEKSKSTRYLSSIIMSRQPDLGPNVISYLREKLPRYDIDLQYMFPMEQEDCESVTLSNTTNLDEIDEFIRRIQNKYDYERHHPMQRKHRLLEG